MSAIPPINRTMDLDDLESAAARRVIEELNTLVLALRAKGFKASSWWGRLVRWSSEFSAPSITRGGPL